ncbi:MAG: hypothetical protein F6K24_43010, partial [Okeania sp. SIO2D1]|nr:hypothetical protein [Okeania sp. SIO2D1]
MNSKTTDRQQPAFEPPQKHLKLSPDDKHKSNPHSHTHVHSEESLRNIINRLSRI